jgi:hypothetical protein
MRVGRALLGVILGVAIALLMTTQIKADEVIDAETCSYQGIPLYGDVQIVDSFPDIQVQVVNAFPDLKVKIVESFPDSCGLWHYTDSFPDFKIQFVDSFPDIQVQFVESFPGIP